MSFYCSQPPGCICEKCLYYRSGRCPHGGCYDDLRAKQNPYDKAHPGEPPRTSWSDWKEDQAYWCRGGTFYQSHECAEFVEYDRSKSVVKDCLEAVVQIFQDGYVWCSLVKSMGCEECMKRFNERMDKEEVTDMKNCGLPKGYEDQCCLNRSGMCTLDTADYSDIDRATGMRGCGFIGVNDRYLMWKYGVPYKDLKCGNCQHYEGGTHGICTMDKDFGFGGNARYSGANACKEFKKQEGVREVAKQKTLKQKSCPHMRESSGPAMPKMYIVCACGRIDFKTEDEFYRQFDICNHKPKECGWQLLHEEVTQLDQEFNHWNLLKDFGGQDPFNADGCNMYLTRNHITYHKKEIEKICSENNLELPEIYHQETPPEVSMNYMARADEIRTNAKKSLELYISDENYQYLLSTVGSLNKKQIADTCVANVIGYATGLEQYIGADKLVDMRRHENPERYLKSFFECAEKVRALKPVDEEKADDCYCETCGHSEDYGESVEYIKCAESGKGKDVKKKQAACANYVPADVMDDGPEGDLEEQLDELLKEGDKEQTCRVCGCTEDNACEGGCYWVEDDLCSACAGTEDGLFYCEQDNCSFNDRECGCQFDPEEYRDEQWHDDIEMAANRYVCKNGDVLKLFEQIVEESAIEITTEDKEAPTCETDEPPKNSGSGSCVNGTAEIGATSNADKPTATIAEDSNEVKEERKSNECYVYRGLV